MAISKRLKAISDMVDTDKIYDVGCDHANLDIYLAKHKNIYCVAIDLVENIIDNVLIKVKKENLSNMIEPKLNNGLDGIIVEDDATIVLSGLGTNTILKILKNTKANNIIIQSNDNIPLLRSKMNKNGYIIVDENIVYEGKYYIIIKFKKGKKHYSNLELELGPIMIMKKNSEFIDYLKKQLLHYLKLIETIPFQHFIKRYKIKRSLKNIKMTLNR